MATTSWRPPANATATPPDNPLRSVPLSTIIGLVVTGVWAMVFLVDLVSTTYRAPSEVNGVMLIVAGGTFGASVVKRGVNGG